MKFDYEKFKGLVHYICYKADRNDLGATKLNKILWFSDALNYVQFGESITGEVYKKESFGPVPSHILRALDELSAEGKVFIRDANYYGYQKKEYVTLKRPNLEHFSPEEISLVDELTQSVCCGHTARSISDLTHDNVWELAAFGEEIPYYTIFAGRNLKVTQEDIDWAHQSISEDCGL